MWKDWCWSWSSNTLDTWWEELTHWKRPWCWERLKARGEGDDRGWDGWMASPTQRTTWANSGSWWRTGTLWLQSMGSQRVGHNLVTEQHTLYKEFGSSVHFNSKIEFKKLAFIFPQHLSMKEDSKMYYKRSLSSESSAGSKTHEMYDLELIIQLFWTLNWELSMWTKNFQMFDLDLEKAEEPEIKLPTSAGS